MTASKITETSETCPAQALLKMLSGKWKPEIFRLAMISPVRFSTMLKDIDGSNRQSLSVALKELEEAELLERTVISQKPLHIEYTLTEKGKLLIPVFEQLEGLSSGSAV